MGDVKNCKNCGKIFTYFSGQQTCNICRQEEEKRFKDIKEYLYQHPGASLSVVSTELNISVAKIKEFLRDGRLEILGSEGNMFLECESCGKAINSGKFCTECTKGLTNDLSKAGKAMSDQLAQEAEDASKNAVGMRYLNKSNKK